MRKDFQDSHCVFAEVFLTFDREPHDTVTATHTHPKKVPPKVLQKLPSMPHQQPSSDIPRYWWKKQMSELQKLFTYQHTSMMDLKRDQAED